MHAEAFFLDATDGSQRLCLHHPSAGAPRGRILYIHPFAEEMNKCRRMAALASRAFAQEGYEVLQIDLLGCGDSSGDFGDARWQAWLDDVQRARDWLQGRGDTPLYLWGLRAGCLLASQAAQSRPDGLAGQLWWQPPASGKLLVQQWLRLKLAGALLDGGDRGSLEAMRQQLRAGQSLEVAGYLCDPELLARLEAAALVAPRQRLAWLELTREPDSGLMPASSLLLQRWASDQIHTAALPGPAFWQTTEIELAPSLIEASLAWLR